mgnify:CR=1 FL=1
MLCYNLAMRKKYKRRDGWDEDEDGVRIPNAHGVTQAMKAANRSTTCLSLKL